MDTTPKLREFSWLEGEWIGKVGPDDVEEIWSSPRNGNMMGMFRWFRDGKLRLMELITVVDFDGRFLMKLKHFDAALHSFEAQNETTDFELVTLSENRAVWKEIRNDSGKQLLVYEREEAKLTIRFVRPDGVAPSVAQPFVYLLKTR